MSAEPLQPVRWSSRRWATTIGVLLFAHLALLFYFGERSHMLSRAIRSRTTLYLATDPLSQKQLGELAVSDPALLALPSTNGFSGKAWLTFRSPEFASGKWVAPPSYLTLEIESLGRITPVDTPALSPKLSVPFPQGVEQISAPPLPIATTSTLRLEGPLQGRQLLLGTNLPSWRHDDLVGNTVVQVLVDKYGNTVTARLITSSGLKMADDFALRTLASARFEPAPRNSSTEDSGAFGRVVFQWHTLAAGMTNSISSTR